MNILFVYSLENINTIYKPLLCAEHAHLGISYISSILKKNGHQTKVIVLSKLSGKKNNQIIDLWIRNFNPRLICFTAVFSEYRFIADLAKYIKTKYKDIFLLIGGVHISLNPQEVLNDDFDALCVGEGEYPTLELASQLENNKSPSNILNLWIKHDSLIEKNLTRPFISNLDELPFPDREIWEGLIDERLNSRQTILLGRGCPFECTYCCNHGLKRIAAGSYVRFRSAENIIEEIRLIYKMYPRQQEIYFQVETIYADRKWALNLCSELELLNKALKNSLSFGANLRITPNTDYEELFIACKKSNFRFITIGLESGNERVRKEILKRDYSNQDIINTVKLARKYGLQVAFFDLIGIPGETLDDFKETIKMNRICLPDWNFTYIFFPYPGTYLHSLCKSNGLLDKTLDIRMERRKAILDLPGFSKRQIQKSYNWFDYDVYKDHRPKYKLLAGVFLKKMQSSSKLLCIPIIIKKILCRLQIYVIVRIYLKKLLIAQQ